MSEAKPVSFALISDAFVRLRHSSQVQCLEQMFDWILQRFPEVNQHNVGMAEQLAGEEPDRVAALRHVVDVVTHPSDAQQEVLEGMHKIVCEYIHPTAMETPHVQAFTTLPYHCQTELFRNVLVDDLRSGATTKAIEAGE